MDNAKYTKIEEGLNDIDGILLKLAEIRSTVNGFSLTKMSELEGKILDAEHRISVNRVLIMGLIVSNVVFLVTLIIILYK